MRWCTRDDVVSVLADLDRYLARVPYMTWESFAVSATGLVASYLSRYDRYFSEWDNAAGPAEIRQAVATVTAWYIVSASGSLAPGDLGESVWKQRYDETLRWLAALANGTAVLPLETDVNEFGHRAVISKRVQAADFP